MLFGARDLGLTADVTRLPGTASRIDVKLFSESNGRFVAEVQAGAEADFERIMEGIALVRLGTLDDSGTLTVLDGGRPVLRKAVPDAYRLWSDALPKLLG